MAVKKIFDKVDSWISGGCDQEDRTPISDSYDIVLHIGAPKTGSSALQNFFLNNRDILMKAGFYYPTHNRDKNNVSGGHFVLSQALNEKNVDFAKSILDKWMEQSSRSRLCLLISAESLYNQFDSLKIILSEYRVFVISYFRDPVEAIVSNYNQVVKRHFATTTLESYIKREISSDSPGVSGRIYDLWVDCFGSQNLIVYPYSKSAFPQEKIELSFLDMLGVPESLMSEFKIEPRLINTSYSLPVLELKRLFNLVLSNDNRSVSDRVDLCLQNYSDASAQFSLSKYERIGSELYNLLVMKFESSNDYIKNNILRNCPEGFLEYKVTSKEVKMIEVNDFKILEKVLFEAFVNDSDLVGVLRKLILVRISCLSNYNGSLYKLADLLGVSGESFSLKDVVFKEDIFDLRQMSVFLSVKSSEADLLREVSIMLERCGQYKQAFKIICRAAELRPKGQAIIAIHDRLKKHFDLV